MQENNWLIEKAALADIDKLSNLYDRLHDFLQNGENYPRWKKGLYPTTETAKNGIANNNLYVLRVGEDIAGTVILNHIPEPAYSLINWDNSVQDNDAFYVHTLAVHPDYMKIGAARKLMTFAKEYALAGHIKAIRLDVSVHNSPAIALYESCGYTYVDTIDLGLNLPELKWFKVYQLTL